jgi:hypothetical protein
MGLCNILTIIAGDWLIHRPTCTVAVWSVMSTLSAALEADYAWCIGMYLSWLGNISASLQQL